MDWVWFLFGFDGRINRAKMWLAMLVILCWMIVIAVLMLGIDGMFGNPAKSIHFRVDDVFGFVDPAVVRAAILRLREGKEASPAHLVLAFLNTASTLLFAWTYLAASIKRLHDRDKSGWWIIPYFVLPGLYSQFHDRLLDSYMVFPFALAVIYFMIWGCIELFFLRGSPRTNLYGPNPLPKTQTRARSERPRSRAASGWDQQSELL